jgi:serine/threonine-protein kinase RsbW
MLHVTNCLADPDLDLVIENTPLAVRGALATLWSALAPLKLAPEASETLELVLAEVLNNIVEHAYPDGARGEISVTGQKTGNRFYVSVKDSGCPMPGLTPPATPLPETGSTLEQLPEGGFGWFLIHALTDDLHYTREKNQNLLTFSMCLNAATPDKNG